MINKEIQNLLDKYQYSGDYRSASTAATRQGFKDDNILIRLEEYLIWWRNKINIQNQQLLEYQEERDKKSYLYKIALYFGYNITDHIYRKVNLARSHGFNTGFDKIDLYFYLLDKQKQEKYKKYQEKHRWNKYDKECNVPRCNRKIAAYEFHDGSHHSKQFCQYHVENGLDLKCIECGINIKTKASNRNYENFICKSCKIGKQSRLWFKNATKEQKLKRLDHAFKANEEFYKNASKLEIDERMKNIHKGYKEWWSQPDNRIEYSHIMIERYNKTHSIKLCDKHSYAPFKNDQCLVCSGEYAFCKLHGKYEEKNLINRPDHLLYYKSRTKLWLQNHIETFNDFVSNTNFYETIDRQNISGVYCIYINNIPFYIGDSVNILERMFDHIVNIIEYPMYFNNWKENNSKISFGILEEVNVDKHDRELYWINKLKPISQYENIDSIKPIELRKRI